MTNNSDQIEIKIKSVETQKSLQKKVLTLLNQNNSKKINQLLDDNPCIKKLNLRAKKLGDDGAKVIAEGLTGNKTLRKLNLGANKVSAEGAKALGYVLKSNKTLTRLPIWIKNIDGSTVVFLNYITGQKLEAFADKVVEKIANVDQVSKSIKIYDEVHLSLVKIMNNN